MDAVPAPPPGLLGLSEAKDEGIGPGTQLTHGLKRTGPQDGAENS